jgi:glycosyltransferase involved in cell wall biosynthesis
MRHTPTVLMIAYLFPPMGGVGVQRSLKFTKYLPEFGWKPHVITVRPPKHGLIDRNLLREIPTNTSITRTRTVSLPAGLPWRLREWITRWILTVDEQIGWYPFATRAGFEVMRAKPVDIIYSSSTPYTAHLVARRLAKATHLPWVADFRDPWVENAYIRFPTRLHRNTVEKLERLVLQEASHVLVISPPMKESFSSRIRSIDPSKITYLPNGYDEDDFLNAQPEPRDQERFTLVYTGSFYTQGRTARSILEATRLATTSGRIPRGRICLRMVGNIGKLTQNLISELDLADIVETPGFVSHEQSIAHLLSADALLLIVGSASDSSAVYTGKIFEYLAANKPIVCLANEGVAADLIGCARAGIILPPDDVEQITQHMVAIYTQWQEGQLKIEPDHQLIQTFERRQQTGKLAELFNGLVTTGQT